MRLIGLAVAAAVLFGSAQAATVPVTNGDFEAPFTLTLGGASGPFDFGAPGWTANTVAGTWEFDSTLFTAPPASIDDRIAFVNAGNSLSQSLGVTIQAGMDYSLSALFGNRLDVSGFAGLFGFYAGDPSTIIGTLQTVTDPGDGLFSLQSTTVLEAALGGFVGLELGIIFLGEAGQINFDNVQVTSIVTPLPAAAWLFGSALLAGGFVSRRRKVTS